MLNKKNLVIAVFIMLSVLLFSGVIFYSKFDGGSGKVEEVNKGNVGEQRKLVEEKVDNKRRLPDINEKSEGARMICCEQTARYWQISDGACYTMLSDGGRNYMILKNDKSIGNFSLQDGYIAGLVRYKKEFYALKICVKSVMDEKTKFNIDSYKWSIGKINFTNMSFEELYSNDKKVSLFELPHGNMRNYYSTICGKNIIINDGKKVFLWNMEDKKEREISHDTRFYKHFPEYTVYDNKMFYGFEDGNVINLYYYDINSGTEHKFYSYIGREDCEADRIDVKFDHDYMYVQDLAIPRGGGVAKRLFTGAYIDDHTIFFTSTNKNIYYIDKQYRVHRITKKDLTDKVIYFQKASDVLASKNVLYIKEYLEELESGYETECSETQNWDDPGECSVVKISENIGKKQDNKQDKKKTGKKVGKKEKLSASYFQIVSDDSRYTQVYQNNYYHLRKHNNKYHVYKNKKCILSFELQSGETLTGFTKYRDSFYFIKSVEVGDTSAIHPIIICRISEKEPEPKKCFELNSRIVENYLVMDYMDDYAKTMFLYEDKVWAVWGDFLYGMRIADGKVVVFQKAPGDWKGD